MAHGSGGRAMAQLIEELFAKHLGNEYLAQGDDGALLPHPGEGRLVMATDSHVVSRCSSRAAISAVCRCMARSTMWP
jgi:hydrogenase expression/formation protein HypE